MANPKKKHTPMRRDMRRSANFRLTASSLSTCSQCKAEILLNRVCPACGYYNGELVCVQKQSKKKSNEQ